MQKTVIGGFYTEKHKIEHIASALKDKRKVKGLSQKVLGKKVGLSQNRISDIETGRLKKVSRMDVREIAKALGCESRSLVGRGSRKSDNLVVDNVEFIDYDFREKADKAIKKSQIERIENGIEKNAEAINSLYTFILICNFMIIIGVLFLVAR